MAELANQSPSHVRDSVPHGKEGLSAKRLCEEIRQVVHGANERHNQSVILNFFSDEKVPAYNVLRTRMMLWVVGEIAPGLVVHTECCGAIVAEA